MRFMPLFLATSMLVFSLISANYSMLLVWVGMFVAVPLAVIILDYIASKIRLPLFNKEQANEFHGFFQGFGFKETAAPPYVSNAILVFFFAYLFFNGLSVYNDQQKNNNDALKTKNTVKAIIGMAGALFLALLILIFKAKYIGFSENISAIFILIPAMIGLAYGWNLFLKSCANSNDLYGAVSNKFAPQTTKICVAKA